MCNCVKKVVVFVFFYCCFSLIVYLVDVFLFCCACVLFILQLQGQTDCFLHHLIEDVKQVNCTYVSTYQMMSVNMFISPLVVTLFVCYLDLLNVCVSRPRYHKATASLSLTWAW